MNEELIRKVAEAVVAALGKTDEASCCGSTTADKTIKVIADCGTGARCVCICVGTEEKKQ